MKVYNNVNDSVGYHITAERGLLNDPNGLIKYKDTYHVFFQENPNGFDHKNKSWGHVFSQDMVNWKRAGIALKPDSWFDKDGVYSGSAIEYKEKIYLYYTGNVIKDGIHKSYQCVAVSNDGFKFKKLGPVLREMKGYTRHVRDPKIIASPFREREWFMLMGAQTNNLRGDILIYKSQNLLDWEKVSNLRKNNNGNFGYMIECPDLIKIDEQFVLLASLQGLKRGKYSKQNRYHSGYYLCRFTSDGDIYLDSDFIELDQGFEFYAPQTFKEKNRIIMYSWMGIMDDETEATIPTIKTSGQVHNLSIPRELRINCNRIVQAPVKELKLLSISNKKVSCRLFENFNICISSLQQEINIEFEKECKKLSIKLADCFGINYSKYSKVISFSRVSWLTNKREFRYLYFDKELRSLRIFIDNSIVEIFVNGGRYTLSARFFCETMETYVLSVSSRNCEGRISISGLKTIDTLSKCDI